MSNTYDFILNLRVIRDYEPDPLSTADLEAILQAGRMTGSSKNRQGWSFIAVTEPGRLQGLAEHGDFTQPVRDSAATVVLVQEEGGNMFDIGRAAQNMMLASKAIGVASCPITLHRDSDAREYMGAPSEAIVRYAIALGYPTADAKPAKMGGRKSAKSVIKYDLY
jgi:nitroreductase